MSRTQYIFVDYENVREVDLDLVANRPVQVELVLGDQQKLLSVEMVKKLLKFSQQVRLVEAGKSGRNALDFVLACRVGAASVAEPQGFYHIVSRDKGFDALIAYLRKNHILARRDETFAAALVTEAPTIAPEDRAKFVSERLRKNKTNRPKRKATLYSQINSYFGKKLTDPELAAIVQTLTQEGVIKVNEKDAVSYSI